jgi:hypothetical protein
MYSLYILYMAQHRRLLSIIKQVQSQSILRQSIFQGLICKILKVVINAKSL